jgi:hypothetical protein
MPESESRPCWLVDGVYRWTCANGSTGTDGFVLRGIEAPTKELAAADALRFLSQGYLKVKKAGEAGPDDIVSVEWVREPEVSSFDPSMDR